MIRETYLRAWYPPMPDQDNPFGQPQSLGDMDPGKTTEPSQSDQADTQSPDDAQSTDNAGGQPNENDKAVENAPTPSSKKKTASKKKAAAKARQTEPLEGQTDDPPPPDPDPEPAPRRPTSPTEAMHQQLNTVIGDIDSMETPEPGSEEGIPQMPLEAMPNDVDKLKAMVQHYYALAGRQKKVLEDTANAVTLAESRGALLSKMREMAAMSKKEAMSRMLPVPQMADPERGFEVTMAPFSEKARQGSISRWVMVAWVNGEFAGMMEVDNAAAGIHELKVPNEDGTEDVITQFYKLK